MKKITFITTVRHNVGDDFVREGIKYLLARHYDHEELVFSEIHKHSPITCRYGFEWLRNYRLARPLDRVLPLAATRDRILEADIVVQSGAPVYWCHQTPEAHCHQNEWYGPLIRRRLARNPRARLFNLAAGTCQRYHSDASEFLQCPPDMAYIKDFYARSALTTVRDVLAQRLLAALGCAAPAIACSSIFAVDQHRISPAAGEYVALNYMPGGGHYDFGQEVRAAAWQATFAEFYARLKSEEQPVFVCHDAREVKAAQGIDPAAKIFFSNNFMDYLQFYARAKFGIMNRVHGAFILASLGRPSVLVGADSRARMAEMIGLESYFVGEMQPDLLVERYRFLQRGADDFAARFAGIKVKARTAYLEALAGC